MQQSIPAPLNGRPYFITLRLADPASDMLVRRITALRNAMRHTLRRHPLYIDAITVLPATLHCIWIIPKDRIGLANRIGMFKSRFSRHLPPAPYRSAAQIKKGEKGIWQRGYWAHPIGDPADHTRHRALVLQAPVHAGLCAHPKAWQYSSIHRDTAPIPAAPKTPPPRHTPPHSQAAAHSLIE
ncbi:MAG: putative transposase [Sulfitobacter sp.]|jgi:REP-associated tyrosine transposase